MRRLPVSVEKALQNRNPEKIARAAFKKFSATTTGSVYHA